ncbi:MAG: 16S rRNA (guanine(527)-N(7))-methyltransferase RsmG [Deltaproteobacteria bacterium]|nr:16S rRNA (guanine(527)-N(7))-methyltransferase RsmG [Deltaproteobacteria bacterium]
MSDPLERYLDELQGWGARMNLVGSTDRDDLRVHLDDSLAAAAALPEGARVVDLGTGAGLPGMPIAIARPDLDLTLVEIRERRVHFLRHVARVLSLDVTIERARIEDPPARGYDFVLARAVLPPRKILPLAAAWAGRDGEVWIWTRETPAEAGVPEAAILPLSVGRGAILRVPAAAVSRGTLG